MKILVCNSFYYMRGGAERCFLGLIDLLEKHGHKVVTFSMSHERNLPSEYSDYYLSYIDFPTEMSKGGIQSKLRVAERVLYSREAKHRIEKLIADTKPDIAHVHGIAHETSPSILPALKQSGIPVVQTLHDYKLLCPNTNFVSHGQVCEQCKGGKFYNVVRHRCKRNSTSASLLAALEAYVHRFLRIYEQNVDVFITPSQFLGHKLVEYGIKNPVCHLPNFIDLELFRPAQDPPEDYFIYSGRLVEIKGVFTLLEAMKSIRRSHLYIVGEGQLEPELRRVVSENNIHNVTFLGYLNTNQLVPLLQKALFTVVPSESYENYSMTVVESLACGTPVIGSRIGGIPEQVIDGWNGLLFEPRDSSELAERIDYLLQNPQVARSMRANARQRVEELNSPQYHYVQTMALYEGLLKQKGGKALVEELVSRG